MISLSLYQVEDRGSIEENVSAVLKCLKNAKTDFLCFPELFAYPLGYLREMTEKYGKRAAFKAYEETHWVLEELLKASKSFGGYTVAGSVLELSDGRVYNTCYVLKKGEVVAKYRKMNPIEEEIKAGITPRREVVGFEAVLKGGKVKKVKTGIMICADCLSNRTVDSVCRRSKLVFLPISMTSPDHPKVEGHPLSLKAARKYNVVIAKTSRTAIYNGEKFGVKSAVISPEGVLAEAKSVDETLLKVDLSL